jgi:hypothetical protein
MKVLLAIGHRQYSTIIRNSLQTYGQGYFSVCKEEVMNVRYLDEMIAELQPDIIIVHDYHLANEEIDNLEEREQFWLNWIASIRHRYDEKVRVVFICERPATDIFLRKLVAIGVFDIFHERAFPLDKFVSQLMDEPRYRNVSHLSPVGIAAHISTIAEKNIENVENNEEGKEVGENNNKTQRPVVKRQFKLEVQPVRTEIQRVNVTVEPKLIIVGGIAKGVGCTFIAHELAFEIASLDLPVIYIENPYNDPYTYDRYAGDIHNEGYISPFQSIQFASSGLEQESSSWEVEGVEMAVLNPLKEQAYNTDSFTPHALSQIIYNNRGKFLIFDIGTNWNEWESIVKIADMIILVVDGDIVHTQNFIWQQPYHCLFKNRMLRDDIVVVGNRMSESMASHPIFSDAYDIFISMEELERAEWFEAMTKRVPFRSIKQLHNQIQPTTLSLLSLFLPEEIVQNQQKKRIRTFSFFKNPFLLRFSKE